MSLLYIPEITDGVLFSRLGDVHRRHGTRTTACARAIPDRHTTVSHFQAVVFQLRLCHACYPHHHNQGGRR